MTEQPAAYIVGNPIETEYWVCNCKSINIHHPTSSVCLRCCATSETSRKATLEEVIFFDLPVGNIAENVLISRRNAILEAFKKREIDPEHFTTLTQELAEIETRIPHGWTVEEILTREG